MSSTAASKWEAFKSRWDAFRSQSHEYRLNNELTSWMVKTLQILRFSIFFVSHVLLIFGTAASKLAVILLATSIDLKPSRSTFKKCYVRNEKKRSAEVTVSVICALWLIQNVPDIMAVIQSLYRIYKDPKERKHATLMVCIVESCRAAGLSILFFHVFPSLDPLHCLVLSVSAVFIPLYYRTKDIIGCSFNPSSSLKRRLLTLLLSCFYSILFLFIIASCYIWSTTAVPFYKFATLPLGLILSSFGFWDLWIGTGHCMSGYRFLYQLKFGTRKMSSLTRLMVSVLRILTSATIVWIAKLRYLPFKAVKKSIFENFAGSDKTAALYTLALYIILLNFFLRFISRFLSAMSMRVLAALHPLVTVVPILMTTFVVTCFIRPACSFRGHLYEYGLRWHCLAWKVSLKSLPEICFGVIWLMTYLRWAYKHVKAREFDATDECIDTIACVLNGFTIEQSLVIYRFAISKKEFDEDRLSENGIELDAGELRITNDEIDKTVTLYICATMWHETRNEMMQMLKSIIKLDRERSLVMTERRHPDDIKYRLEAHVFFDDAWEDQIECGRAPNGFFKAFFRLLLELTQNETSDEVSNVENRVLVNTAYGGRLVARLPAGTLLFVHLKDKKLVRHKKRWSQVMYMYYLLGHRIMDSHMSVEDRQLEADNTYILAIDGDSKFEPSAVLKLLRLMNVKNNIGCACGRIHPIGEGVMVWYQKFEYAIAHWFQKAAEHIFGCVLCAPGCFSLFRASALMDDNVMHKYTKTACEPRHFVQYDQGEDRWLSTLLLKKGYRIEYAAAADAETYAPEGFQEFFNQRRRWTPSSIANTIDLLADYKRVCENNDSISKLYILYQMLVIGFSLLSPGIMFTMLVYAQVAAFEVGSDRMLLYNIVPVFIFIALCFLADSNHQLIFAKCVSVVYGFVMLAVVVATANQIILETALSPTSMFVLCMIGIFFLAALIHPQEFHNIFYGLVFFLMIPCTYVFLSLYALINLNVINWGTREAASAAVGKSASETGLGGLMRRLGFYRVINLVKALPTRKSTAAELQKMKEKVTGIEAELQELKDRDYMSSSVQPRILSTTPAADKEDKIKGPALIPSSSTPFKIPVPKEVRNRFTWMDAEYLQVCSRGRLNPAEDEFWNSMIEQYLKPIEITEVETKRDAANLANLRNRIASSVLIVNGLLVLAVFLIQKHKEILSFQYKPYEGFEWLKLSEKTGKFELTGEPLKVEPLGLIIIAFLLAILLVQTCGMFAHRVNTLAAAFHEVSNMEDFDFSNKNFENEDEIMENARQMFDTKLYDSAHGADGYIRVNSDVHTACNVLYKLQRARLAHRFQRLAVPESSRF